MPEATEERPAEAEHYETIAEVPAEIKKWVICVRGTPCTERS